VDILAAIASDPSSLPLWLVLAFAAGMYPVGMLFSCTPCCNPCSLCNEGSLPETVTVTFSGFDDRTRSADLCSLAFSSCYGSGASGKINAPGGDRDTDAGPISEVQLLQSGSGYAKLGRVEPTLSVTGSGVDAEFTVTLSQEQDGCGIDYWKVSSVVASGGNGYTDGESLVISAAEGDHYESEASLTLSTQRTEPELVFQDNNGSADLAIEITQNAGTPETWSVTGVTIEDGGAGYYYGEELYIVGKTADDKASYQGASILLKTELVEPTLAASVDSQTGVNASLSLTLTESTAWDGRAVWGVTAIAIDNAGAGYAVGDAINIIVQDGYDYGGYFSASVSEVSESGGIVAVDLQYGGEYYKDLGVIIDFDWGYGYYYDNSYYRDAGVPSTVTVNYGGVYYREDPDEDPYVAEVTVTVNQTAPSDGNGAVITATVEDDTASADFGKIKSLAIDDGGDGYLAWVWTARDCCGFQFNDKPIVLARQSSPNACLYTHTFCSGYSPLLAGPTNSATVSVRYLGPNTPPVVTLAYLVRRSVSANNFMQGPCARTLVASDNISNCDDFAFAATDGTITADVEAGGDYDPLYKRGSGYYYDCHECCQGEGATEDIEVSIEYPDYEPGDDRKFNVDSLKQFVPPGVYVLARPPGVGQPYPGYWGIYANTPPGQFLPGVILVEITKATPLSMCAYDQVDVPENDVGCGYCVKKCVVSATVGVANSPATGAFDSRYLTDSGLVSNCDSCEDVPICTPPSGFEWTGMAVPATNAGFLWSQRYELVKLTVL